MSINFENKTKEELVNMLQALQDENSFLKETYKQTLSKLKTLEDNTQKAEEKFLNSMDISPEGFTILKPVRDKQNQIIDFIWVFQNKSIAKLNGTDSQTIIGKRLFELFPEHENSTFTKAYKKVAETGKYTTFIEKYKEEKLNTPIWFRILVLPMADDIAIFAQDITEQKLMDIEVKEKNEQFETIMKGANLGWWDWDIPSGDEIYNDILAENLGYKLNEITPHITWWENRIHPDDSKQVAIDLEAHFKGKTEFYKNKHRLKTKTGQWKWFLDHGKVVKRDSEGNPIRMIGTLRNIDYEERAKEKTLQINERFSKLIENMPSGVAIYKPINEGEDFEFININKEAENITKSSKSQLIGHTLLEMFPNMGSSPLIKALRKVHIDGENIHIPPFYYKDEQREGWRENNIYKLQTGEIVAILKM